MLILTATIENCVSTLPAPPSYTARDDGHSGPTTKSTTVIYVLVVSDEKLSRLVSISWVINQGPLSYPHFTHINLFGSTSNPVVIR